MRKKMIAGNWKMNKTAKEALEFTDLIKASIDTDKKDVVLLVPFIDLAPVAEMVKGTNIKVGAQNMYYEENGAFTGEISPSMITETGACYVLAGHSERRAYFGETDEIVNKKALKAAEHGLIPIICVGETLTQREQGITSDLIRIQTKIALRGFKGDEVKKIVIAYEPVWAIGTGKTATSAEAQEVIGGIRKLVCELYDSSVSESVTILYGGSVNASNAKELFGMPDIDGGLVGGASLKDEFIRIVNFE